MQFPTKTVWDFGTAAGVNEKNLLKKVVVVWNRVLQLKD